jgi:hypothetical protein
MNAEIVFLRIPVHKPLPSVCWPCIAIWAAAPMFWVSVFAWWVLR